MRKKGSALWRRLQAAALAVLTVWAVWTTAGSDSAAAAAKALREALPLRLLRWELGLPEESPLSVPAVLVLRQAPLLYAAREEVLALWEEEEEAEERPALEPLPTAPVKEQAVDAETVSDNGAPAKTLLPAGTEGYTVCGSAYISNSTRYTLTEESLRRPFSAALAETDGPQVLIIHTHGSEAYTPPAGESVVWSGEYRTTDSRYNVVNVGDAMAEELGAAGISVLHDRTLYDYPSYGEAYDRSLAAVRDYLAQYPSIRFVLDVHRDAVADSEGRQYKVVSALSEENAAAQLTLVVGSDGSGLEHPDWMENLRLAVALQQRILEDHPTLMRPLLLRNSRYNQHTTTGSLLVEAGAAGNSPEEAELAGRIFARQLAALLTEQGEKNGMLSGQQDSIPH